MRFSLSALLGLSTVSLLFSTVLGHDITDKSLNKTLLYKVETTVQITEILSLYGFLLDTRDFSLFNLVYTDDVVANVATPPITGLPALVKLYKDLFTNQGPTIHASQNVLVYDVTATNAKAGSYNTVTYFGTGSLAGQIVTYYERFQDVFTKVDGTWKISERTLTLYVSRFLHLLIETMLIWRLLHTGCHRKPVGD